MSVHAETGTPSHRACIQSSREHPANGARRVVIRPLMMGYEGGDLLLTGAARPTVRSPPRPVSAGCGRWPGWPAALVSDDSALEAA